MTTGASGATPAGTASPLTPAVELSSVRFSYQKGREVLAIDALTIARGETVFLHGPSGSGKTTLLGLLAGVACIRWQAQTPSTPDEPLNRPPLA